VVVVDIRVVSMNETILFMSPRAVMRASTSSGVKGTSVPVTAGTIVRIVLFRANAMCVRNDSAVATTLVLTSDAISRGLEVCC
jgi:hypothetical protein